MTRHLQLTRAKLIETGFYLGDGTKPYDNLVVWKHIGNRHQLVTIDSANTAVKPGKFHANTVDAGASTSNTVSGSDILLDPAILSVIIAIDYDNCWVTPCGYWKGPTTVSPTFEHLKLSFQGKSPSNDFLSQDFVMAVNNVKGLMKKVAVDNTLSQGFLGHSKSTNFSSDAIKFCCVVFEVLSILLIIQAM